MEREYGNLSATGKLAGKTTVRNFPWNLIKSSGNATSLAFSQSFKVVSVRRATCEVLSSLSKMIESWRAELTFIDKRLTRAFVTIVIEPLPLQLATAILLVKMAHTFLVKFPHLLIGCTGWWVHRRYLEEHKNCNDDNGCSCHSTHDELYIGTKCVKKSLLKNLTL